MKAQIARLQQCYQWMVIDISRNHYHWYDLGSVVSGNRPVTSDKNPIAAYCVLKPGERFEGESAFSEGVTYAPSVRDS